MDMRLESWDVEGCVWKLSSVQVKDNEGWKLGSKSGEWTWDIATFRKALQLILTCIKSLKSLCRKSIAAGKGRLW